MNKIWVVCIIAVIGIIVAVGNFNSLQSADESVNASWSEVINQYQRRADLIPNIVKTVKEYANHEKAVFIQVTEARAKVGAINISAKQLNDPAVFKKFQNAQQKLSSSLSKLLAVAENYPQLKADTNFRDLQAQLEGTENRIAVARNRYIKALRLYNVKVRTFPSNILAKMLGYSVKQNFSVKNESQIATPPLINFDDSSVPRSHK